MNTEIICEWDKQKISRESVIKEITDTRDYGGMFDNLHGSLASLEQVGSILGDFGVFSDTDTTGPQLEGLCKGIAPLAGTCNTKVNELWMILEHAKDLLAEPEPPGKKEVIMAIFDKLPEPQQGKLLVYAEALGEAELES